MLQNILYILIISSIIVGIMLSFTVKPHTKLSISSSLSVSDNCSKPCGGGKQYRKVTCNDINGNIVDDSMCDKTEKPVSERDCNTQPC